MSPASGSAQHVPRTEAPEPGSLRALLDQGLAMHFQPIVNLREARVHGHEALVRGPVDSPLAMPEALFDAARREGALTALEFACVRTALESWAGAGALGKLFVNLSASALTAALGGSRLERSMEFLRGCGVASSTLVVELTEHERVNHSGDL